MVLDTICWSIPSTQQRQMLFWFLITTDCLAIYLDNLKTPPSLSSSCPRVEALSLGIASFANALEIKNSTNISMGCTGTFALQVWFFSPKTSNFCRSEVAHALPILRSLLEPRASRLPIDWLKSNHPT